jgi:hypothetical protein
MKYVILGGAILLGTLVGVSTSKRFPAKSSLEDKVAAVAEGMNSILPKKMTEHITFQSAHAEGTTIVLEISGMPAWRPDYSDEEAAKMMSVSACHNTGFQDVVATGASVRIQATAPDGSELPPLLIDHCPRV